MTIYVVFFSEDDHYEHFRLARNYVIVNIICLTSVMISILQKLKV